MISSPLIISACCRLLFLLSVVQLIILKKMVLHVQMLVHFGLKKKRERERERDYDGEWNCYLCVEEWRVLMMMVALWNRVRNVVDYCLFISWFSLPLLSCYWVWFSIHHCFCILMFPFLSFSFYNVVYLNFYFFFGLFVFYNDDLKVIWYFDVSIFVLFLL